jgi:hypothetical protein
MSRFSVISKHPSILWLLLLGVTILAPMLISIILWIFTTEIILAGLSFGGALAFTILFMLFTLLAASFWQALLIQGVHKASTKKSFRLLDAFTDVRVLFGRTTALFFLTALWICLLSVPLLYVRSLALEITLGLLLLFTPFFFLKTNVLLRTNTVFSALKISAKNAISTTRVFDWAWVKTLSFAAIIVVLLGSYSLLAEIESFGQIIRVVLSFLGFSWMAVFSPLFGFLLLLGGNGIAHVATLFVVSLLLHFSYVVVLTKN